MNHLTIHAHFICAHHNSLAPLPLIFLATTYWLLLTNTGNDTSLPVIGAEAKSHQQRTARVFTCKLPDAPELVRFTPSASDCIQINPSESHRWVKGSRVWCDCAKQGGCDLKPETSQIMRLETELYQRVYAWVGAEMGSALCTCSIVPRRALIRKSNNINM